MKKKLTSIVTFPSIEQVCTVTNAWPERNISGMFLIQSEATMVGTH